jgi:hypothetical protein
MTRPQFMSAEHVAAMNVTLADSAEVREASSALERTYTMAYVLSDGREGRDEYWLMSLGPDGVHFALDHKPDASVIFRGDWRTMVEASKAGREGRQVDPGVTVEGDAGVLDAVATVFATAQRVATLEVDWP